MSDNLKSHVHITEEDLLADGLDQRVEQMRVAHAQPLVQPVGAPVAPALILHSEVYRDLSWYLNIFGNLHARQEWELFQPMLVGDRVRTLLRDIGADRRLP